MVTRFDRLNEQCCRARVRGDAVREERLACLLTIEFARTRKATLGTSLTLPVVLQAKARLRELRRPYEAEVTP